MKSYKRVSGLGKWQRGAILLLLAATLAGGCRTVQYIPVETNTEVHIKDSLVLNIKDSIRITERTRYKDYGDLLDTLRLDGNRAHSRSWIDTTKSIIAGELVEDPVEEKTKVVYKTKIEYRDSVRIEKEPYPVEVPKEVKVVPKFWKVLGIIGIISILLAVLWSIMKLKTSGFLSKIISIFK